MTEITEARKDSTSNPTVKIFRLIEIMILGSIVCLFILIAAKPDIADATLSFCGIKITIGKQEILKQLNDIIEHRREPELEKIQIYPWLSISIVGLSCASSVCLSSKIVG